MTKAVKSFAHGRVNLIGEHTDYNGGWVLPTTIPQRTNISLTPRSDSRVLCKTQNKAKGFEALEYILDEEVPRDEWIDYIQGATKLLRAAGHQLKGFDIEVDSTVPVGSGLSSSAALEVALMKGLREAFSLKLTDVEIAQLGQRIENEFVGARVGIMDQMACALATAGEALFLDTMKLTYETVPLPLDEMELVVINSGVVHRNSGDGGYNQRRAECEEACKVLGVSLLREVEVRDLPKLDRLPDKLKRRARHVITENHRVHQAVSAIKSKNLETLGQLFKESHFSMRDDYEVSVPEIDLLVELCWARKDVFGARLTGGGFGGSIVAAVHKGAAREVARAVAEAYSTKCDSTATIMVPAEG